MGKTKAALEIGIATADITPPLGVRLAGYGPRKGEADGIGHRLRAEAMVTKGADAAGKPRAWALVTSDVIGYPLHFVREVRQKVAKATDLAPEAILISGTHTHSGPSAIGAYSDKMTDQGRAWREGFREQLADLIIAAWKAAEPGEFEVAWTEAPELGSNRRIQQPDGTWFNDWIDAEGRHTGYFDPAVMIVAVRRPDGRRDALLVNYGCHPVTLGPRSLKISGDYVSYVKDFLEAHCPGVVTMFALAGAGNINPRLCIQVGAKYPRAMGERLGAIVLSALCKLHPVAGGPVTSARQPWRLVSKRKWPKEDPDRKQGQEIETELMALRAGDLAMVSVPGELFSEYAAVFREASPLPETVVISLANESVGYLPVDEAFPQGGHEINHAATDTPLQEDLAAAARAALRAIGD